MRTKVLRSIVVLGLAAVWCSNVSAEEVEKKFRIGAFVGGYHTDDEVRSDSANIMVLVDPARPSFRDVQEDPRNDGAAIGTLTMKPALRFTMNGQYAFTRTFLLEGSIGYQQGDVGEVEMQGQLDGDLFDTNTQLFNFKIFRFTAGEVTQVPLALTAMWRFRPRTTFNPFFGIGGGYTFVQFNPSSELDNVSTLLDSSVGRFARQSPFPSTLPLPPESENVSLEGAEVEVEDFLEWHADGGFEWAFARKWAFVVDLKYTFTTGTFRLRFNGANQLGVSVPLGEFDLDSEQGQGDYGTYYLPEGSGLVDVGCRVSNAATTQDAFVCVPQADLAAVCSASPGCTLRLLGPNRVVNPADPAAPPVTLNLAQTDGLVDSGYYYVRWGDVRYGGASINLGLRFTF